MKDNPVSIVNLLAHALPVQSHISVVIDTDLMPLIWVDERGTADTMLLQARLTTLGKCLDQFSKDELN